MKHLSKFFFTYLLFIIGTFSASATNGHEDHTIGDFIYRLYYTYSAGHTEYEDHVYVVSGAPDIKLTGDVVIPENVEIQGKPYRVNGFLNGAFYGQDEMTSITFPSYEGDNASWLNSASYGNGVFQNCSSLKEIEIPGVVHYIGDWFEGCTSLESVTLLDLDDTLDYQLPSLNISYSTFSDSPIKSFSFNRNIAIQNYEDGKCIMPDIKVENITIGEKVTFIPSGLFTGRTDLFSFTIPDHIEEILKDGFKGCTNLTDLNLGKVIHIRDNAFTDCPLSETLVIPGTVVTLERPFQNCSNVHRLVMETYVGPFRENIVNDGNLFTNTPIESAYIDRTIEGSYNKPCTFPMLKSVEFGPSVKALPAGLLQSCPIEEIIFGEGIKSFEECSVPACLTKLVIPAQVEEIETNAVSTLNDLDELIFEDGDKPLNISYRRVSTTAHPMFEHTQKLRKIYIGRDIYYNRYTSLATPDLVSSQQLYSPFRDLGHPIYVTVGPGVTHMDPDMFYDKKYSAVTSVNRIAMPEGIELNGGYPYMKCVYPRDAIIHDGVIFDPEYTKLYWVDIDYEGEIRLPETMREIGSVAMRHCRKASIDCIPPLLEKIGDYAFDLSGIEFESIVFPETMKEIGAEAFASCKIESVTINAGLEKIGQGALTAPNEVVYNARNAVCVRNSNSKDPIFSPSSIIIGDEVEYIPELFLYHTWMNQVSLPKSLKGIGDYAFGNAYLTDLTIPGSVETIGTGAFEECVYLKNIKFEKGSSPMNVDNGPIFGKRVKPLRVSLERDVVDKFGNPAQVYSNAPTTLYVGPDVKNLYRYSNLRPYKAIWNTAVLPSGADNYNLGLVANYTRTENLLSNAPGCTTLKYLASMFDNGGIYYVLTSPTEALAIDCSYSSEDKSIEIPAKVESPRGEVQVSGMLPYTFTGNTILEEITLGFDGTIEQNAFQGCSSLKNFTATGNLSSIATGAFNNCQSLEEMNFLGAVETLKQSALANLLQLRSVHFSELHTVGPYTFEGDTALQDIDLPETVTSIGNNAFYNCKSLERISMPASLEDAGSHIFYGCSNLKEVDLESNIAVIPDHTFNSCSALEEVNIPDHIGEIKTSAFTGCTALKALTIHPRSTPLQFNSYEKGKAIFSDAPIETIHLGGDVSYPTGHSPFSNLTSLHVVTMDDNVSALPEGIFSGCINLDEIHLGEGVETIGAKALEGCENLTKLSTPDRLATIGEGAFRNCMALSEVTLGPSVSTIGANAFDGANSLVTLYSEAQEPPLCETNALEGIDKFGCELHVPTPSVPKYQNAPQWGDFFTIKGDDISTQVEEVDSLYPYITYISGGLRVKGLAGKEVTVTSLDGKTIGRHYISTDDQYISLPPGCWIITFNGRSQRVIIE